MGETMDERVAKAVLFNEFVSTWGERVSYRVSVDGSVQLYDALHGGSAPEEAVASFPGLAPRVAQAYTRGVHPSNPSGWTWDKDILRATTTVGGRPTPLEKFSWNPKTGEFVFIRPDQNHSSARTKDPFDDYVRGVVLSDRGAVTLRPAMPSWLPGYPSDVDRRLARVVSAEVQEACKDALTADGSVGWSWQINITNVLLEEMTGRHRW